MTDALLSLSASEAVEQLRAGDISAAELFELYAGRIEKFDGELGSFLWKAGDPPEARRDTPLAGVPRIWWQAPQPLARNSSSPRAAGRPPGD